MKTGTTPFWACWKKSAWEDRSRLWQALEAGRCRVLLPVSLGSLLYECLCVKK